MRKLVSDVITEAQRRFPDLNAATALDCYNRVVTHLSERITLVRSETTYNIVEGQSEYPIPYNMFPIFGVRYSTAENSHITLQPTELSLMESRFPGFRNQENNQPSFYYVTQNENGGVIALHPSPNTTTSSGYPIFTIYHGVIPEALTSATNAYIPAILPQDGHVIMTGICALFAEQRTPELAGYWRARYGEELGRAHNFVNRLNIQIKPQFTPSIPSQRRVT